MMSTTWWPGGLVLLVGVVGGLFIVWRLKQAGGSAHVSDTTPHGAPRLFLSKSFVQGFGTAAVLAVLVFWAIQDGATVDSAAEMAPEQAAERVHSATAEPAHDHGEALPAELEARLTPLRTRLAQEPDDLAARKEIAVLLLRDGKLFQAYEEAEEILRVEPDDVDGLYVHGVVRVAMGQSSKALALLDRVLAQRPEHSGALTAREEALMKMTRGPSMAQPAADRW